MDIRRPNYPQVDYRKRPLPTGVFILWAGLVSLSVAKRVRSLPTFAIAPSEGRERTVRKTPVLFFRLIRLYRGGAGVGAAGGTVSISLPV